MGVLGIEVTVPALAVRCGLGNIDPQHSGGDVSRTAIEDACSFSLWDLEQKTGGGEVTLATVRSDLDAIGAMAVLSLNNESTIPNLYEMIRVRVEMVAAADKFARGGYPGLRPLPSASKPWPEETATAESSRPLAAIAAAVMDFKVPIADRVATMKRWLVTGEEPAEYRSRVEAERLDMIRALESGAIKVEPATDGRIAVVVCTHRAATTVGYAVAPVVIALNPQFRFQGGDPHAKFTVCQFQTGYVDLKAVVVEITNREPGWGGSPTIIGSPQGHGSTLTVEEVTEVVANHLINK